MLVLFAIVYFFVAALHFVMFLREDKRYGDNNKLGSWLTSIIWPFFLCVAFDETKNSIMGRQTSWIGRVIEFYKEIWNGKEENK